MRAVWPINIGGSGTSSSVISGAVTTPTITYGHATGEIFLAANDGKGVWVIANSGANDTVARTYASVDDGNSFGAFVTPGSLTGIHDLKYLNGYWWLIGSVSAVYSIFRGSVAADGTLSWTAAHNPVGDNAQLIAASATGYVVAGTSNFFHVSDPVSSTWTQSTGAIGSTISRINYSAKLGAFLACDGSSLYVSTDGGVTFSVISSGTIGTIATSFAVSEASGRLAVFGASAIKTSDNTGVSWTSRTSGTTNAFRNSAEWTNGVFYAGTNGGEVISSTDGAIWTKTVVSGANDFTNSSSNGRGVICYTDINDFSEDAWWSIDAGTTWIDSSLPWGDANSQVNGSVCSGVTILVFGQDSTHVPKLTRIGTTTTVTNTGHYFADRFSAPLVPL